jgi:hypothetical protein
MCHRHWTRGCGSVRHIYRPSIRALPIAFSSASGCAGQRGMSHLQLDQSRRTRANRIRNIHCLARHMEAICQAKGTWHLAARWNGP